MGKVLALALSLASAALGAAQSGTSKPAAAKTSLTGCVDEHDGQYVLTNDINLQPTANLSPAAGSPEDNFARHMGQKVKVRGVLSKSDAALPTITVDNLDVVSETCAPASGAQQ
jgi:hypothetical protein